MINMKSTCGICAVLMLFVALPVSATEPQIATVIEITDGDTLVVDLNGHHEHIRLACIDAPEKGQPGGWKAKRIVLELAQPGDRINVHAQGRGRYARIIVRVITAEGLDLSRVLVTMGAAWSRCRDLKHLEDRARANRIGIWSEPSTMDPRK
jgi:endonuclease YncB( thermonuclease family)